MFEISWYPIPENPVLETEPPYEAKGAVVGLKIIYENKIDFKLVLFPVAAARIKPFEVRSLAYIWIWRPWVPALTPNPFKNTLAMGFW